MYQESGQPEDKQRNAKVLPAVKLVHKSVLLKFGAQDPGRPQPMQSVGQCTLLKASTTVNFSGCLLCDKLCAQQFTCIIAINSPSASLIGIINPTVQKEIFWRVKKIYAVNFISNPVRLDL